MAAKSFANVGTFDRVLRAIVGLVALSLVFVGPKTPWGYLGLLPLLQAAFGWCAIYQLFGISTRHKPATL